MDDFISKIEKSIKNNPIISIFIFFVIVIFVITSKYATNIGIVGGLFILYLSFKRFNQTEKQISLTEDNNLNKTFKDAVTLLGEDNVSVRMGGVYTLIDIAKKNPTKYSKRINDILCNYIVEQTNKEPYNTRHIQKLVDLILVDNNETFKKELKDLSGAKFIGIFFNKNMQVAYSLNHIMFIDTIFEKCAFWNISFNDVAFIKSHLKSTNFSNTCIIEKSKFHENIFEKTFLYNHNYNNHYFPHQKITIKNSIFENNEIKDKDYSTDWILQSFYSLDITECTFIFNYNYRNKENKKDIPSFVTLFSDCKIVKSKFTITLYNEYMYKSDGKLVINLDEELKDSVNNVNQHDNENLGDTIMYNNSILEGDCTLNLIPRTNYLNQHIPIEKYITFMETKLDDIKFVALQNQEKELIELLKDTKEKNSIWFNNNLVNF